MHRVNVRAGLPLIVGLTALSMWACDEEQSGQGARDTVSINTTSKMLAADGVASADLNIIAVDFSGAMGTGTVDLTATAGDLEGNGPKVVGLPLSNGRATIKYWCDASKDTGCVGAQTVKVQYKNASDVVVVTFLGKAGGPDAGQDAGTTPDTGAGGDDGGVADTGTAGPDAGPTAPPPGLTLKVEPPYLYRGLNQSATVTATLAVPDGGPVANAAIKLETSLGGLAIATDAGMPAGAGSLDLTTNAKGEVSASWIETNNVAGTGTITATEVSSGLKATQKVDILTVNQIVYQGFKCDGVNCNLMGIRGSGWNERGVMSFKVMENGNPASKVHVTFTLKNAPLGTSVTAEGDTNAAGIVTATVTSGWAIGSFQVTATVSAGVTVDSPSIGVRGAKVSKISFDCASVNLPAFATALPPNDISIDCSVLLLDRYNNRVGTGQVVHFLSEAGNMPSAIATREFDPAPGADNKLEGTAKITFNTRGDIPLDVSPLAANPNHKPFPVLAEPANTAAGHTYNPRDGLVTLIAYTDGEEFLDDKNNSGVWEAGEFFIDQALPFVDSNDNDTLDAAELFVGNDTGSWVAPNNTWDKDTKVWKAFYIMYSGWPHGSNCRFAQNTFKACPMDPPASLDAIIADINNVPLAAANTSVTVSHMATTGVLAYGGTILDQPFFTETLVDIDANGSVTGECKPAQSAICRRQIQFMTWNQPITWISIASEAAPSADPCPAASGNNDRVFVSVKMYGKDVATISVAGYTAQ